MKIILISPERNGRKKRLSSSRLSFLTSLMSQPLPSWFRGEDRGWSLWESRLRRKSGPGRDYCQTTSCPRAYQIADELEREESLCHGRCPCQHASSGSLQHVDAVVVEKQKRSGRIWSKTWEGPDEADLCREWVYQSSDFLLPRRDLLNEKFYFPLKLLETTRGCPHRCDFCGVSKIFRIPIPQRPIPEIERELSTLFQKAGDDLIKKIPLPLEQRPPYFLKRRLLYIIDSNIAGDKRFALNFSPS